jgi:hypothetical protein
MAASVARVPACRQVSAERPLSIGKPSVNEALTRQVAVSEFGCSSKLVRLGSPEPQAIATKACS